MFNLLFADRINIWNVDLWYAVPVIIAIGLVYAASRHEQMRPILVHAGRVTVLLTGFMLIAFVAVELVFRFL